MNTTLSSLEFSKSGIPDAFIIEAERQRREQREIQQRNQQRQQELYAELSIVPSYTEYDSELESIVSSYDINQDQSDRED